MALIKTLHILSASIFFMSACQIIVPLLKGQRDPRFLSRTGYLILPFGIIQWLSGFTLISLHHYELKQSWLAISLLNFLILVSTWFMLVFFINSNKSYSLRGLGFILLYNLLSMIFFMTNHG